MPETSKVSISVAEAARIMGKSRRFVQIGLQTGKLPFGWALKLEEDNHNYNYFISRKLFEQYVSESEA